MRAAVANPKPEWQSLSAPGVEFSWEGNDEMDPARGRGWALLDGDEIEGRIFLRRGDDSAFRAVRRGR